MSKTLQIRVDDVMKNAADELFQVLDQTLQLPFEFSSIAIETGGLPFEVKRPNKSLKLSMQEVLNKENLSKPYKTAKDAINAMLEDQMFAIRFNNRMKKMLS